MTFLNDIQAYNPEVSLNGYLIAMLADTKFGKTSFALDLANIAFGDLDSTLLLAAETGYKARRGVRPIDITCFDYVDIDDDYTAQKRKDRGFIEVVDELISARHLHKFRFLIIDTVSALERYAKDYIVRRANALDNPDKAYNRIKDIAWGGGYDMAGEEVYKQFDRLIKAGFGLFVIGHTKTKQVELKSGEKYQYIGFDVLGKISDVLERESDFIIYGETRTEVDEVDEMVVGTERILHYRSNGNFLAGTRFPDFPASSEYSAETFYELFKTAVKSLYDNDMDAIKKVHKEKVAEREEKASKFSELDGKRERLLDEIKELVTPLGRSDKMTLNKSLKSNFGYKRSYEELNSNSDLEKVIKEIKTYIDDNDL